MDEENFISTEPLNVDAIVANDGDEFLYNADADAQGGENFYGQNQSLAGDGGWWDDNYPGQNVQNPDSVSNTTDYGDYGSPTGAGAAGTSTTVTLDPYSGLTPNQLEQLGNADPTDPYIRARLGIPQLPNSPLTSLPSTSNFFNSIKDVAASTTSTVQKAVSALTAKTPAANPYAQQATVQRSLSALTPKAASPTQDAYGLTILDAAQTAQLTSRINPAFVNGLAPTVNTGAGAAIAAANQQTAASAARLNAGASNPYLTNIDQAAAEISRGQEGIATATQTIQSAQQKIADSESIIAQQNAELADPNISAERRAVLEANNAEQTQNIFDQTQSITENQTYIATTQETIQFNEASIDTNSASYRATTAGSNVPVVDVNADPNFRGPQQITATAVNPTTTAAPINIRADGEGFGNIYDDGFGGFVNGDGQPVDANGLLLPTGNPTRTATAVDATTLEGYGVNEVGATVSQPFGSNPDAEAEAASAAQVGRQLAQQQAVLAAQKRVVNNSDWRVRLQLAPGATYLYNAPSNEQGGGPGILWPLRQTDGVIFPYTPKITMNYKADYEAQILTHSNYKGYFYKSSYADAVQLNALFTAQDTSEAQYLLAVIHFFRAVTKMFYGQDPNRGAPPPLVYLTGLGEFQFTQHPCVVANFNYSLPSDVDYIRARSTNVNGTNLLTRRNQQSLPTNPISGAVGRLQNLFSSQGINKGALFYPPPTPNLGQNQPTYVPTKLEIDLTLYPMQSRQQVSKVFDNRQYNNGAQLKGGFW